MGDKYRPGRRSRQREPGLVTPVVSFKTDQPPMAHSELPFLLTPREKESTIPFCPDEPTEAMRAKRDPVANFFAPNKSNDWKWRNR